MALAALLVLLAVSTSDAADAVATLRLQGQSRPADATVRDLAVELVKSSNFNTVAHASVLKQSVPALQARYRRVVAGDCLVVTYPSPVKIRTVGGEVTVFEIVVSLEREDRTSELFTIDAQGRVVGHGKYSGGIAIDLRRAVSK